MGISKFCATDYKPRFTQYVYSLRNPLSDDIFYVGKTASPYTRLLQHSSLELGPKAEVIRELKSRKLRPIMEIIDQTDIRTKIDSMQAEYKEIYWIQKYNSIGWNLLNVTLVNSDLFVTDYYSKYLKPKENKQKLPLDWYYYTLDKNRNLIYDRKRLKEDGRWLPIESNYPGINIPEGEYNPFKDERSLEKMGYNGCFPKGEQYYIKCYNDTNPSYYDYDY